MFATHDLTKWYGKVLAPDRLAMEIPESAVFGLLGPNGSGKSTLVRLLMGFIFPDAGRLDRGGLAPWQIGYLPERPYFPPRSPAGEYLRTVGSLNGLHGQSLRKAVDGRLEQVGLAETANWRIGAFSKGMLQRLSLAAALLSDPPLAYPGRAHGGAGSSLADGAAGHNPGTPRPAKDHSHQHAPAG